MTKVGTDAVRKSRGWTAAAELLQNWCLLLVAKLSSVVANEENRIAHMESAGTLQRIPIDPATTQKSDVHRENR